MSKTKKVLSLVMAVALLFNVLGVISFAACANDKVVGIVAESDDALVAGGQVTVDFSFELPAGTDYTAYKLGLFQLVVSYNEDVLTPVSRQWGDCVTSFVGEASGFNTNSTQVHGWISSKLTTEEAVAYTGSAAVQFVYNTNNSVGVTSDTGWSMSAVKDKIFSITFNVADDYDGTAEANVGVLANSFQVANRSYIRDMTTKNGNKLNKDGSEVDWTEASATLTAPTAAAEPKVEHVKTMGQMSNWTDATATTFNAGLVGRISNLEIEFDDKDECTTVTDIIVSITYGEKTLTGNAYQLYEQADGSYLFRAVVRGAEIADATDFSYKYIVTLSDGSELTYESTEDISFSKIYNTAKANYDAANPAA